MKSIPILTSEESDKLLLELSENFGNPDYQLKTIRNYTMALLMLDAGLRVGEVVRLWISDLILSGQPVTTLHLSERIARKGAIRHVPLRSRIQEALMIMNVQWWKKQNVYISQRAFTPSSKRHAISVRQVQRIIRTASIKSIGREIHPHVLRHTFATNLMRVTSTRVVQELLGHKKLSSTQIYTHPNSKDLTEAIEKLK